MIVQNACNKDQTYAARYQKFTYLAIVWNIPLCLDTLMKGIWSLETLNNRIYNLRTKTN